MVDYLIVIDFEANCKKDGIIYTQEIIEFPAIPINLKTNEIEYNNIFHHYCKIDTKITDFATKLTGITQKQSDNGKTFKEVYKSFKLWLLFNNFMEYDGTCNFIIVTCGNWDFEHMFPSQCKYSGIQIPTIFKKWCNVKELFNKKYNFKPNGLIGMLDYLKIKLEGHHHSGIDDTKNIAKICKKMLIDNTAFHETNHL